MLYIHLPYKVYSSLYGRHVSNKTGSFLLWKCGSQGQPFSENLSCCLWRFAWSVAVVGHQLMYWFRRVSWYLHCGSLWQPGYCPANLCSVQLSCGGMAAPAWLGEHFCGWGGSVGLSRALQLLFLFSGVSQRIKVCSLAILTGLKDLWLQGSFVILCSAWIAQQRENRPYHTRTQKCQQPEPYPSDWRWGKLSQSLPPCLNIVFFLF